MAYSFGFDSSQRVFLIRFDGQVTDEQMHEYYRAAYEPMKRLQPRASISDFSRVTDLQISPETVRRLAHSYIVMPASNARLVVAPSPHVYGLARMFQIEGEPKRTNLHVVTTLAEAFEFLGVQDLQFDPIPEP